jgi:hypothetical protein
MVVADGARVTEMGPAGFTMSTICAVAETGFGAESVALTTRLEAPGAVGVPEIVPELLKINPVGSAPVPAAMLQIKDPVPPIPSSITL